MKTVKIANKIKDYLIRFHLEINVSNNVGLYDVNKLSQGFCAKLLNIFYYKENLNLIDLDVIKYNYKAIDLGDANTKVAYQVTSQNDFGKINSTIDKYLTTGDFKGGVYTYLRFLILNTFSWSQEDIKKVKKKYKTAGLSYDNNKQIVSLDSLGKNIKYLWDDDRKKLYKILKKEFKKIPISNDKTFDYKLFKKFNKILNESDLTNIFEGLYAGSPYNCIDLHHNIIDPFTALASRTTGVFINPDLQNSHKLFIQSLNQLSVFLMSHYSTSIGSIQSIIVPYNLTGWDASVYKGNLTNKLDEILDEMRKSYAEFRGNIKDLYFI